MSEQTPALIRDALPAERDALVTLAFAAYEEYRLLLPQNFWERYRTTIRQSIGEDEAPQRIVAELEGRICGTVLLYPGDEPGYGRTASVVENAAQRSPEIRLLAVDPAMRGHGLGQMLMQECIRRTCISHDIHRVAHDGCHGCRPADVSADGLCPYPCYRFHAAGGSPRERLSA